MVVKDRFWLGGRLVEEIRYESEREVEAAPVEEEGEDNAEWEGEMEDEVRRVVWWDCMAAAGGA